MGELKEKMGGSGRVGLSADALKWIAMITMFIDHLAHTSLNPYGPHYVEIYTAMRTIGRIAFPLYCFLLVEGFMHTGNYRLMLKQIKEKNQQYSFRSVITFGQHSGGNGSQNHHDPVDWISVANAPPVCAQTNQTDKQGHHHTLIIPKNHCAVHRQIKRNL